MSTSVAAISDTKNDSDLKLPAKNYLIHSLTAKERKTVKEWTRRYPDRWLHVKAHWGRHVFRHSDASKNFEILVEKSGEVRVLCPDKKNCEALQRELNNSTKVYEPVFDHYDSEKGFDEQEFKETTLMQCVMKYPRSGVVVT